MMKRPLAYLGVVAIVLLAIAVPVYLYVTKDEVPCYPPFDGTMSCYADTKETAYRWYSPKTDYAYSTGLTHTNVSEYVVPGCEPVMLYLFARHSARFPDIDDLVKMSNILHQVRDWVMEAAKKGKVKLCQKDIEELRNWEQGYQFSDASLAMEQGNIDTHNIAERLKRMFPTLLPSEYSNKDYKFGYSNRERTNQSLQAFAEVIFNETEFAKIEYPPKDVKLVSFHKHCERRLWPNRTKPSREWFVEPEAYRVGPVTQRLVENVKARLGLQDKELTYSDVRQLAVECAISYTAYRGSPWCGVFSKDDLLVTEYDDDIYDFYKDTYGRPLNPKMGCPVVNELVKFFRNAADKPSGSHYKSVLYFAHSRDYKKLLGSFGLFSGDDLLTAAGYCDDNVRNRIWREAKFSPYSAQLGFVLFKCKADYKVLALVNEKPTELPRCSYPDKDFLCDLREFISKYHVKNCNINKICVPSAPKERWPDSHWEDKDIGGNDAKAEDSDDRN